LVAAEAADVKTVDVGAGTMVSSLTTGSFLGSLPAPLSGPDVALSAEAVTTAVEAVWFPAVLGTVEGVTFDVTELLVLGTVLLISCSGTDSDRPTLLLKDSFLSPPDVTSVFVTGREARVVVVVVSGVVEETTTYGNPLLDTRWGAELLESDSAAPGPPVPLPPFPGPPWD
jgi:hypothetical protein